MTVSIAIDCMGGDHGLSVTIPAALSFAKASPDCRIFLVGREDDINGALARFDKSGSIDRSRLLIRHASETVQMDDAPAAALRGKRDSSMRGMNRI